MKTINDYLDEYKGTWDLESEEYDHLRELMTELVDSVPDHEMFLGVQKINYLEIPKWKKDMKS